MIEGLRQRSLSDGRRSHFLISTLSLFVLLDSFQGVVGHREGDFDFGRHLSQFFPYVTNVHFCTKLSDTG
jgi:hypothetical protein